MGESEVTSLLVEFKCPEHGLERFRIKIIKRFNMNPNTILPRFRTRPKAGEIKFLAVGRNVTNTEIERYFVNYFREKGLWDHVLRMRLI